MKNETQILIIDNDYAEAEDLKEFLESKNYKVSLSLSVSKAKEILLKTTPSIIFMEVEIGEQNGLDLCFELRKKMNLNKIIIVFHSHQSDNFIQISALNAGADDYLVKPISQRLLLSKIQSYLRRIDPQLIQQSLQGDNKLIIDTEKYLVVKGNKELSLPKKQFEILHLMYQNPKKVYSREDLKLKLWNHPEEVNNRTIDVHIKKLREIIGDHYIKTVKGVGYKLDSSF